VKKLWVTANVNFELPLSMEQTQAILDTYHRTYPGVQQYWARQIAKCRRSGYAETLAGRRVQLKGSWINRQTAWQLESSAVNFPIQGIGADQKYLAIKVLQNYLTKYGGRFYFELHDGLYAILPERKAEEGSRAIRRALSNLPYQKAWGFTPPIPLPWDLKMGANWGEMTEVESD
jgi:DNA polymerase I-like protein with 3'-5' exonuclease and polymerase domains